MIILLILSQFSLADSLYANKYYNLSQIEFQREFFFHPELRKNQEKRLKYGISLIKSDTFGGIEEFNNLNNDFPDLDPKLKTTIAKCYINLGYYYQASKILSQTEEENLLGYTHLLNNRLVKSRDLFFSTGKYKLGEEINEYINQPKKSVRTAALLSFVCPGAGEIYAGDIKRGVADFLLTFGSGYLIYNSMKQKKYVDAFLIFNFLFQRFYLGSVFNAQRIAQATNEKNRQAWLKRVHSEYFQDLDLDY
jgi:hypothetical protein